jgi:flagellin
MSIRINYNPMSVLTHRNLANTDRAMGGILDRLSSGERLRRSADDPASMVLANAVRYTRMGGQRAGSNAEEAVTMLQTAEGGMDQIGQVLQRMRGLALSAMNEATQDPAQLNALQLDLDAAVKSITTIASSTTYGGVHLIDGSLADATLSDDARLYYDGLELDHRALTGGMQQGSTITFDTPGAPLERTRQEEFFGAGTPSSTPVSGPGTMTISGPQGSSVIGLSAGATIASAVSAINAASASTGVQAGYDEATGIMTLESTSFGSGLIAATSDIGGFLVGAPVVATNQAMSLQYTDAAGQVQTVLLQQDPTSPGGRTFVNVDGGPEFPPGPYTVFQPSAFSLTLRDTTASGTGTTLAPPPAGLTATRTSTTGMQLGGLSSQRITLEIPDLRAGALGHGAGLAAQGLASIEDLLTGQALVNGQGAEALQLIDEALTEVNRARGAAGSLQGNTVERVMESLRATNSNLAEYESILRDVDMAAESAEYARIQVMMQAATAMLAQANQVPQTVLQLLK